MEVHTLLLILSSMTIVGKCCLVTGINTITSHRLLGHVYKHTSEVEFSSCVSQCEGDTYCLSVNYDFVSQRCELNEKNSFMAPGKLQRWASNFYVYGERIPAKRPCTFTLCQNGGKCEFDEERLNVWCRCKNGYTGRRCEVCANNSLGLQDGRIPDYSFTASSYKTNNLPHMARLEGPKSWMPLDSDDNKYLQIDLAPHRYVIVRITVSGDPTTGFSSSSYYVKYKDYNESWKVYGKKKPGSFHKTLLDGSSYAGGKRISKLDPPIKTTVIRILPQAASTAYRLELYGCRLTK